MSDPRQLRPIDAVLFDFSGTLFREELTYWPFTHEELDADLRAAGWEPAVSTWSPDVDRYLVTARSR